MKATITIYLILCAMIISTIIGWIANVVWLFNEAAEATMTQLVIAISGLFIPIVGGIHGWMYMT